jgi:hypothetical protein
MKVNELIALLKTEDQNKELRLDVHIGDSIHKEESIKTIGITSVRGDEQAVWICFEPDHITNVYSASGFGTYSETAE